MAFVKLQRLTRSKKKPAQESSQPPWAEVEKTLRALGDGSGGRLQLADAAEERVMTVYGEDGAFHLGIAVDGSEFHFYTSGGAEDEDDNLTSIAWNQAPKTQVCRDVERVVAMVRRFYDTGERLESVRWISERF